MIYIGCHETSDIDDGYLGSGVYLKRSIKNHGKDFFKRDILFKCPSFEEMMDKEVEIVNEAFVARLDTYNLTIGGKGGGFHYIKENGLNNSADQCYVVRSKINDSEEYKEWFCKKVSNGLKLYYENNEGSFKGKRHSKESKKKIGVANSKHQQGTGNSQYGTMWITNELENKKVNRNSTIPDGWKKGRVLKKK